LGSVIGQWDEGRDVLVLMSQAPIESRQPRTVMTSQGRQISIRDLPMANQRGQVDGGVVERIRPENVPRMCSEQCQHACTVASGNAFPQQQANQGRLGDRTGGERRVVRRPPPGRSLLMHMVLDSQGDQDVAVQKVSHSSSSAAARTISVVTGVPSRTTGRPVRASTSTAAEPVAGSSARRTSSLTVWLRLCPRSRAREKAARCSRPGG